MNDKLTHGGGCHCGDVRFEIDAPADIEAFHCNCSICAMTGYEHLFVAAGDFRLLTSWKNLETYEFNTRTAKHHFCKRCGIKSFYVPRSHPDGYSINLRCLRRDTIRSVRYGSFDGADWERNSADLPPL